MLTPADINNKQFGTTRLKEGYDQVEVDDFLDRVSADYDAALRKLQELERDNATLRRINENRSEAATTVIPTVPPPPSAVAEKLLAAAESAAREFEAEAKIRADDVIREAGDRGSKIVEEAVEAAERIRNEGYAEKIRKHEELERKHQTLALAHDGLATRAKQLRAALLAATETYDREAPE